MMDETICEYKLGYVGVIDILGFSSFSQALRNRDNINSLMHDIYALKSTFERGLGHVRFSILSDTIVVIIELTDQTSGDFVYFDSVVRCIGLIRTLILNCTNLYSRTGITFGYYYYDEKKNIIFGPAITRGATLAEKADQILNQDCRFKSRPVAILIDNIFLNKNNNIFYHIFEQSCVISLLEHREFKQISDTNFFIYNPYYKEYDDFCLYGNYLSDIESFESFCTKEEDRLKLQLHGKYARKFKLEKKLLSEFKRTLSNKM